MRSRAAGGNTTAFAPPGKSPPAKARARGAPFADDFEATNRDFDSGRAAVAKCRICGSGRQPSPWAPAGGHAIALITGAPIVLNGRDRTGAQHAQAPRPCQDSSKYSWRAQTLPPRRPSSWHRRRPDRFVRSKLVADADEEKIRPRRRSNILTGVRADRVPSRSAWATGDERWPPAISNDTGGARRPGHGAPRDFEFFRKAAQDVNPGRKNIHVGHGSARRDAGR